jgi:Uma2 family endonuclease
VQRGAKPTLEAFSFLNLNIKGHALTQARMTAKEFLVWDPTQTVRHQFVRGEVFAMAGADERHVNAAGNIYSFLRAHLNGTPCKAFNVEMKLQVEQADCYFYPDVLVTCSAADLNDTLVKRGASVVVEVLSPSTAAYDRGEKFTAYRLLPSLREYLLVNPRLRRCDLYRKGENGLWVLHPFETDESVTLASIDVHLNANVLWDEVPPYNPSTAMNQPEPHTGP